MKFRTIAILAELILLMGCAVSSVFAQAPPPRVPESSVLPVSTSSAVHPAGAPIPVAANAATVPVASRATGGSAQTSDRDYILSPEDLITVQLQDAVDYQTGGPVRIESSGYIKLPSVTRIMAAGLTPEQLEDQIATQLAKYYRNPQVTVRVTEFHGEPVTVIGSVTAPGVHQLHGHKTLLEVISLAGGLALDAGSMVTITRSIEAGQIPLKQAHLDVTGDYSICAINVRSLMDAVDPAENIIVKAKDVISVAKAPVVYVAGSVKNNGEFVLKAEGQVSVLQAVAMAGGLAPGNAAANSKIIRKSGQGDLRQDLPVDLKKLLTGKGEDLMLQPGDILFVPSSVGKTATLRAIEAAIQIGTGLAVFR